MQSTIPLRLGERWSGRAVPSRPGQIQQIGYGVAAGVLMDTFLLRSLLVPSLVVLLGRWNWWPSHLARNTTSSEE
jgi:uncharacterized membrane protein YdfJ with MMPL/SSD domain